MKNSLLIALALTAGISTAHAQTSTWAIDPAHSSVNFTVVHMGVSKVHGSLSSIKGEVVLGDKDITKSSVNATIDTTTVSTGVTARDNHLKSADFFDVAKNPTITFKSTAVTNTGGALKLIGDLTIGTVSKSVTLDLDGPTAPQTNKGKTISGFSASGLISRKDFNFGQATPASAMISDAIKFSIDVEIDKK